ncbi:MULTISPECIES: saccharopine dehydrogenase family protein [Streptomyces]|uniref:Saccharopine dehydrogenase family protein n=2 Tax=Streptomyces TaxID=1883 RepID=A0ABV9IXU0_9ACTN
MKIAVYGAYGYQGNLVVAELSRRGIDTVLVGRNVARLQSVGTPDAERRVADTDDHDGLVAAFRGAEAVINCAGPFTVSGIPVIHAAVAAGCHYVDTSGEQLYLKQVFDTFSSDTGVTIVPGANDDCLPGDLIAALAAARVAPVEEVVIALDLTRGTSTPSRGTLRSALANLESFTTGGEVYDGGQWRPGVPVRRTSMIFPGSPEPVPVVKFALPGVATAPRHLPANWVEGVARAELVPAFSSVTPDLIDSLPEGPTAEHRRTTKFVIVVHALGTDGRRARGVVEGTDTYGTTAVIAVEAARRLAADPPRPGALAPAQAYDPTDFLNFLAPHAVTWTVEQF